MKVKIPQAFDIIERCARARLVPMVHGSPGIGKSDLARKLADKYKLKLVDIRLSSCDPTDLNGFPHMDSKTGKGTYLPMDMFPVEGDEIPEGYKGWLVLLDEMNSAPPSVQAAAYKVTLDGMVGMVPLHKNAITMAAGNLATDGAIVNRLGTAMQSRLVHVELEASLPAWLKWADENDIDKRIYSYLNFRPDHLHSFQPDHNDKTFACPRTWEFLSRLIKDIDVIEYEHVPMMAGTISEGVAREFYGFLKVYKTLPDIDQILANPDHTVIPEETGTQFALTGLIAEHLKKDTTEKLMRYLSRLPLEFQVITLRSAYNKNPAVMSYPSIDVWASKNAKELTRDD